LEGLPGVSFVKALSGLRMTVPAAVADGRLEVTLRARVGRVPRDYGRWLLRSIRVRSRTEPVPGRGDVAPAAAADLLTYGWQPETSGTDSRLMYTLRYLGEYHCDVEKDKLLGDCVADGYDWGPDDITFNVDVPNGTYAADCYLIQRYGGTPLVLDCFAEGALQAKALALKDTPGGIWGPTRKVPMRAEVKDGQLNLRFVIADPRCKSKSYTWGLQAVVVRPAGR
jgi:hypothetical protein